MVTNTENQLLIPNLVIEYINFNLFFVHDNYGVNVNRPKMRRVGQVESTGHN